MERQNTRKTNKQHNINNNKQTTNMAPDNRNGATQNNKQPTSHCRHETPTAIIQMTNNKNNSKHNTYATINKQHTTHNL